MKPTRLMAFLLMTALTPVAAIAQSDTQADTQDQTGAAGDDLLTTQELQDLVAPVALYPDTLLIQILVAATYPLDVVKADRLVQDNEGNPQDEVTAAIESQGWDESVEVLATAFPDVLADMAVHVDWTEAIGTAMLAQDDDVMSAVQDMRDIAHENGALQSGDEQTVEVTQEGDEETIIIQPADPQTVYVPQYDPEVVYVEQDNSNDLLTAGLITFGTFILIDAIFDNNDPWHDYWGCRNCGGWGGGPIIHNPDIDIDIDGDVNIGNGNIGWKPEDKRRDEARDKISDHRDPDRASDLKTKKPDRGDEMRQRLSDQTGAADISRPDVDRSNIQRPEGGALENRAKGGDHAPAIDRTRAPEARTQPAAKPAAKPAPKVQKPAASRPAVKKPSGGGGGHAIQQRAAAPRAQAGGARGRAAGGGQRGRR